MARKEAPPDRRTPQPVTADGGGVTRKRRWANPEKSGGAKSRSCRADLKMAGAMPAGLQSAKSRETR